MNAAISYTYSFFFEATKNEDVVFPALVAPCVHSPLSPASSERFKRVQVSDNE